MLVEGSLNIAGTKTVAIASGNFNALNLYS